VTRGASRWWWEGSGRGGRRCDLTLSREPGVSRPWEEGDGPTVKRQAKLESREEKGWVRSAGEETDTHPARWRWCLTMGVQRMRVTRSRRPSCTRGGGAHTRLPPPRGDRQRRQHAAPPGRPTPRRPRPPSGGRTHATPGAVLTWLPAAAAAAGAPSPPHTRRATRAEARAGDGADPHAAAGGASVCRPSPQWSLPAHSGAAAPIGRRRLAAPRGDGTGRGAWAAAVVPPARRVRSGHLAAHPRPRFGQRSARAGDAAVGGER